MIVLKEQIDLAVPFEKLLQWAHNFETEFVKWSPYHIECEYLDGGIHKGARVRFYEIVAGMDYDVTGTIIESELGQDRFSFTFLSDKKTASIRFEGDRTENGCRFSHTESFGMKTPIIGPIINFLIFKVIFRKKANMDIIRRDMILDNEYLRQILTENRYPERLPLEQLR